MNDTSTPQATKPVVWKLDISSETSVVLVPKGAIFLNSALQIKKSDEGIYIGVVVWFLVSDRSDVERRTLKLVSTGEDIPHRAENLRYLATIMSPDTSRVDHLFEVIQS